VQNLKLWVVAVTALASAGCSLPVESNAEYDKGIVFEASDGVVFKVSWWADRAAPSVDCPIVIHLKDGTDLNHSHFVSPKVMRGMGGKSQRQYGDEFDLMVWKPEMVIGCDYKKQRLAWVMVNLGVGSKAKVSLTIDGKAVSLPISEKKLFEALGEPSRFEKHQQKW
jgi:hypothetical protein